CQTQQRLEHPNLVRVITSGTDQGHHFLVLELIRGQTLYQFLMAGERASLELTLHVGMSLATALEFVHGHDLIHRDIKPGNIFIAKDGCVKLTDFGLVKDLQRTMITFVGEKLGTPRYMPPEALFESVFTQQSDIYQVGMCLFEIMCLKIPYEDPSLGNYLNQLRNHGPTPLSKYRPDLPKTMEQVVGRCLAYSLSERYPDANALLQDLQRVARGDELAPLVPSPVVAPPPDAPGTGEKRLSDVSEPRSVLPEVTAPPEPPAVEPDPALQTESRPGRRSRPPGRRVPPPGPGAGLVALFVVVSVVCCLSVGWAVLGRTGHPVPIDGPEPSRTPSTPPATAAVPVESPPRPVRPSRPVFLALTGAERDEWARALGGADAGRQGLGALARRFSARHQRSILREPTLAGSFADLLQAAAPGADEPAFLARLDPDGRDDAFLWLIHGAEATRAG
ncbi:MAG: serine/threonine protein kinase, partial [Candidatus Riflebacteria bacterium]|nr:serine/threonine protein kinase [Candidatus Riflebacteria bacterium]